MYCSSAVLRRSCRASAVANAPCIECRQCWPELCWLQSSPLYIQADTFAA